MGNLVADAMARSAACHSQRRVPLIALIESGSVRGAVKVGKFGRDEATNVLPWANRLEVVRFPSVDVLESFIAFGAQSLKTTGGGFLQASGNVRIVLNDDRARVFVRHFDCSQTQTKGLTLTFDDTKVKSTCPQRGFSRPSGPIDVVFTSWLANGGDGFSLANASRLHPLQPEWLKDVDALRRHVASLPEDAIIRREGRIAFSTECAEPRAPEKRAPPLVAGFLGAFSMMASFVATYPLSTLQTRAMLGEPLGLSNGCSSLYRGVALAALAVYASGAVFWTAHEFLNHLSGESHTGGHARQGAKTFFLTFVAGALNVLATNPLWVAVTRLQGGLSALPSVSERKRRWCWPCAGILPNTVLVLFPTLRQTLYEGLLRGASASTLDASSGLVTVCAAFATLIAATATHPLQWYRSRLQAGHGTHSRNASVWDGLSIKLVHTVISNTLMYLSKEQLTQFVLRTFLA